MVTDPLLECMATDPLLVSKRKESLMFPHQYQQKCGFILRGGASKKVATPYILTCVDL